MYGADVLCFVYDFGVDPAIFYDLLRAPYSQALEIVVPAFLIPHVPHPHEAVPAFPGPYVSHPVNQSLHSPVSTFLMSQSHRVAMLMLPSISGDYGECGAREVEEKWTK